MVSVINSQFLFLTSEQALNDISEA